MPRRPVRRESNVGLIVTLIFFILTSVGLGVATYYGFSDQDRLKKEKKEKEDAYKDIKAKHDWYQFQALLYRTWLGQTAGFDNAGFGQPINAASGKKTEGLLQTLRQSYDNHSLGNDGNGKDLPDKADVTALITKVEGSDYLVKDDKAAPPPAQKPAAGPPPLTPPVRVNMAWDKNTDWPAHNYEEIYWGLRALIQDRTDAALAALKEQQHKIDTAKDAEKDRDDWKTKYETAIADLNKFQKDFQTKVDEANADLRAQMVKAQKTEDEAKLAIGEKVKKEHDDVLKLQEENKVLGGHVTELKDQLALNAQKTVDTPSEGKPIPTDWKIVRMDRSGKQPFINLGTAANVQPGLTFSIHGQGPDGRPIPASKGTLEVLDVVSDNLSQAQVVSVKDSFKDPILPGDYLYNPIFHPGGAQHVVIAGRIDMHGTKGDDLEEFRRLLKRQNVVVDAYVDPQDGSIKDGRLTVGTDYLVLGDITEVKDMTPMSESIKKLQEQAKNNGVRIIPARDFLESMGYKTP